MVPPTDEALYRAFLRTRWAPRTRALALAAALATPSLVVFDLLALRLFAQGQPLWRPLALRLPTLLFPALGWVAQRALPSSRLLPALTIALALAWTWSNDAVYFALGLGERPIHMVALSTTYVLVAAYAPLRLSERAAVQLILGIGHLALARMAFAPDSLVEVASRGAMIVFFALTVTVAFEDFARSQRRGVALRRQLEETVAQLDTARRRAEVAAEEVGRLAAAVAHDVNNPLAAVKVNVRQLADGEAGSPEERAELIADTRAAIDRIAAIVISLRNHAAERLEAIEAARGTAAPRSGGGEKR